MSILSGLCFPCFMTKLSLSFSFVSCSVNIFLSSSLYCGLYFSGWSRICVVTSFVLMFEDLFYSKPLLFLFLRLLLISNFHFWIIFLKTVNSFSCSAIFLVKTGINDFTLGINPTSDPKRNVGLVKLLQYYWTACITFNF